MRPTSKRAPAASALALLCLSLAAQAGPPPPDGAERAARFSLVTILPGKALYSSFGHTAIRVVDGRGDRLYNFGLSAKDFDLRFALDMLAGRMEFMVAALDTGRVLEYYREAENRGIVEQTLALDEARRLRLIAALDRAVGGEGRTYNYRYFDDNCVTRPFAILRSVIGDSSPPFAGEASKTRRSSLHEVLGPRPWLDTGIGLVLGPIADRPIPDGPMFLPQDLMRWAAKASYQGPGGRVALVARAETIYEARPEPLGPAPSPLLALSLLLALALLASAPSARFGRARRAFDAALFSIAMVPFIAILVLWLSAGYAETGMNVNLLWSWPLPLLALVFGRGDALRPASLRLFRIAALTAGLVALGGGLGLQSIPAEARMLAAAVALRCAAREGFLPRRAG
jgi:hypothetical protein